MSLLSEILAHNAQFVASGSYERFRTDQFPNKKMVLVSCMDTRLVELLPRAMNLRQGDVKIIKVAGAIVSHPFGSVMRSILVAIYELGAAEVAIVGHHGCGMAGLSCERVLNKAKDRGVSPETLDILRRSGIDLDRWLTGFERVEDGVSASVEIVRSHPLVPKDIPVHGLIMCPETGRVDVLVEGYAAGADSKADRPL
jgi:carbonic anhydrase